jgi:hypothetical protein
MASPCELEEFRGDGEAPPNSIQVGDATHEVYAASGRPSLGLLAEHGRMFVLTAALMLALAFRTQRANALPQTIGCEMVSCPENAHLLHSFTHLAICYDE